MPCVITREEELAYEQEYNKEHFGLAWTDNDLTTAVACWLAHHSKHFDKPLPAYVAGWIKMHAKDDMERAILNPVGPSGTGGSATAI